MAYKLTELQRERHRLKQHEINVRNRVKRVCVRCGTDITGTKKKLFCINCFHEGYKEYRREYQREWRKTHTPSGLDCCKILLDHHEDLKYDPEHLTTDFIKKLSKCECDMS
jgi:hypothetical protein